MSNIPGFEDSILGPSTSSGSAIFGSWNVNPYDAGQHGQAQQQQSGQQGGIDASALAELLGGMSNVSQDVETSRAPVERINFATVSYQAPLHLDQSKYRKPGVL